MAPTAAQTSLQSQQAFDPLTEARSRWPGLASFDDTALQQKLQDPNNFRAAFPEYSHLDDETIQRNMAQTPTAVSARHARSVNWDAVNRPPTAMDAVNKNLDALTHFFVDTVNPTVPVFKGPDSLMQKYVEPAAKAQEDQFHKASEEWARPGMLSKVAASGHALAGALPLAGPMAAQSGEEFGAGAPGAGTVDAVSALLAGRGVGETAEGLAKVPARVLNALPRQEIGESLARPTIARPLSKLRTEERYGANPERAIVSGKLMNSGDAEAQMNAVGQVMDEKLTNAVGQQIDTGSIIDEVAHESIRAAQRTGRPNAARSIQDVADTLKEAWGNPNKAPRAAAEMYRGIRKGVKYGPDPDMNAVSDFRKSVSSAISNAVKQAVPDVTNEMQQYQDTAAAYDDMKRGEDQRSMKGPLAGTKESAEAYVGRKAAQLVAGQPKVETKPYAEPFSAAPQVSQPRLPAAGLPPAEGQRPQPLPGPGGTGGGKIDAETVMPPQRPPAKPLTAHSSAPALHEAFDQRGTDLQSEAGPSEKKPIALSERFPNTLPSGEKPIEAPASTYQKPSKAEAAKAAAPPPTENELKAQLATLDRRYQDLNAQYMKSRGGTDSARNAVAKLKEIDAQRTVLRERLGIGKPEARPIFSAESSTGRVTSEKPEAKPLHPAESQTPTFDSLPKEDQEWIRNWSKEIDHLPQSLRESEVQELQKFGTKGGSRIEQIARQHASSKGLPIKRTTSEESTPDALTFMRLLKNAGREPGAE